MEKLLRKFEIPGRSLVVGLLIIILLAVSGQARKKNESSSLLQEEDARDGHFGCRYVRHGLDINDFRIPMTNYAIFGQLVDIGSAGGEWPKGSDEYYIYGAGIWVSGTINDRTLQTFNFKNRGSKRDTVLYNAITDPRVVVGYNPSGGIEEFSALTDIFISDHPEDYSNPDFWPLRDQQGNPIILGIEDSYTEYDDQDQNRWDTGINSNAGDGIDIAKYGLGVKAIQRTCSWNYENNKTIHFFIFDLMNIRQDRRPIRNCFVSVMCDGDIGPTANDDLVGFNRNRNMGYEYDSDLTESGFARMPGFLVYQFLQSPQATYDVDLNGDDQINEDSVLWNGVWVKDAEKGQSLGLTSFKTSDLQAGDPDTERERYLIMAGHIYPDYSDQHYAPFYLGTGIVPLDQRFFENTGPFILPPVGETVIDTVWHWDSSFQALKIASIDTLVGDTVRVVVALLIAPDFEALPRLAGVAQSVFHGNFILPKPPEKHGFSE